MALKFNSSKKPTIGVEIELQIINPKTFDLVDSADLLLKMFKTDKRVTPEVHQSTVEINSEISLDVKECRTALTNKLLELTEQAEQMGLTLSMSGTHPFQKWNERLISNSTRYQNLHDKYQWLIRRMDVYGLHVHIGMEDKNKTLLMTKAMIRYLPHLLALSANSPFWQGMDTGMDSSRITIMESFPFSGLPFPFSSWAEFTYYFETLKTAGAIQSLKDLYWHIRPNAHFGTLEFRICDSMTNLSETMALTALIQCLVVWLDNDLERHLANGGWSLESHWIAPENNWIAARYGLSGVITKNLQGEKIQIAEEVAELIEILLPTAQHLNCEEELLYLKVILEQGNGASRQRKIYAETNSFESVVMSLQEEFFDQFYEKPLTSKQSYRRIR